MIHRAASLGLLACACTGTPTSKLVQPGDTAITDVTVVPMSRETALAHHTVVIRGDRIVAVAPHSELALPAGVTVIDGTGKWLMPGLADMHVHSWTTDDLTMFVAAGVTTIRNMWGIPQHLTWRAEIARGERLGPTIVTAGPLIDGDPPDWPGSVVLTAPRDAEPLVAAQRAAGYDFVKPVSKLSRDAYEALAAAAARHGMVLAGHVAIAEGLAGALAAHQRSIEHLDGYLTGLIPPGGPPLPPTEEFQPWLHAVMSRLDPARLPALIDQTVAAGTWNCPTLIIYDRVPELYDVAAIERRVAWLHLIPVAVRASWAREHAAEHPTADDVATVRSSNAQLARITAALAAANAPLLVGTDAGGGFVVPGESLHDEIELMVAAGVPRARVLRAATADAWRYLGQPHEAGVIEVGARADLLLVAGDPLSAPLPLVPDGVMIRGKWLPRGDLEARLAAIAARAGAPDERWRGAAPLAVAGAVVDRARYDTAIGGAPTGQERVAIGATGDRRTIVGQLAELAAGVDVDYQLGPDTAVVAASYHTMTLQLTGALTGRTLVVTGTDLTGAPVSLRAALPAGAFLSAPGIGGATALAARLTDLKPGARRTLQALELGYFPAIAIVSVRHDVERKPDRGGHRVFAVATARSGTTVAGELVVDPRGFVVEQSAGPPIGSRTVRRP